jgi:GWxTD domain-containing protein
MRRNLIAFSVSIAILASCAVVTVAQDDMAGSQGTAETAWDWKAWDSSPEGYLLTKQEKKDWKKITTEAQAKRFVELFWVQRNPDPAQPFNTFKAQFESRVRFADDNFSYEGRRGSLTDRGKVLILMGPPHQAESRAPTETVESMDDAAAGTDEARANAALWLYDPARLPEGFSAKGSRLLFIFYENRLGSNNFTLDRSHQEATISMRTLSKAPEAYLLHPKLNTIPKPVSVPGGRSATAAHLAWLEGPDTPFDDKAIVLSEPGVADAGRHRPWWLHVELPADAPKLDLFAGQVVSPDGEVLSTFETTAEPRPIGDNSAYHLTFPLRAGDYMIELVGSANEVPQVAYSAEVSVPEVPVEGTWMSPIWFGLEAEVEDGAMLGEAYCFGRLHLMPLTKPDVTREHEISYFGFVVRPGASENNEAQMKCRIELKRDGKRMGRPLDMPLVAFQVADDLFVYANSIALAALPELGEFSLGFTITDAGSEVAVEREVAINITE